MLWWFAQTTLIAGALAVVATLAGRWKRLGPETRHALWLLVLIKLAIPPFIAWPWSVPDAWATRVEPAPISVTVPVSVPDPVVLPAAPVVSVSIPPPDPTLPTPSLDPIPVAGPPPSPEEVLASVEATEAVPTAPAPRPVEPPPGISEPAPASRAQTSEISNEKSFLGDWKFALLAAWLMGSVVVVARRGFKVFRFHRSLAANSKPAPDWLVDETRAIGDRIGVRPPPIVATPRVATPLLWCLGRPRLILPEILIKRLGVDRWPGILAHELAHLARGDHWVVRLELLVEAAWWWNPLFWFARRRLHEEAEIACDARVVRSLPERRYAYAEALVDVCEHIARAANPSPSLGVGGPGAAHSLEGRLHMILRDPIPRRPSRRAAVLAALLAALALPAWTLGQQPEPTQAKPDAPTSKPEAPASAPVKEQAPDAPAPKPAAATATEAPRPVVLAPNEEPESIEAIRDTQKGKWEKLGQLSFHLVVADRERSRVVRRIGGADGWPLTRVDRSTSVAVKVADVVLGPLGRSRSDVLEAKPMPEGPADPAGPPRPPVAWDRRLVALDGEGYTALEMAWDKPGPVPFRGLGARGRQAFGDSLTSAFFRGPNTGFQAFHSSDLDRQFEPLDPRPRNVLELYGVPTFLKADLTRAEVLGIDKVDGRDAVRIAWSATADIGLRGLCWAAPELGYAVVLLNATQDPTPGTGAARRSWQRRSRDFVKVTDHLWLPRKVTFEEALLDPAGGEPTLRREREMTFEGYRIDEPTGADTFRPRLAILGLDDRSGNFTADPPALPVGLVDRLAKSVAASKFGPPIAERTFEETKAVATMAVNSTKPDQPNPVPDASQPSPTPKPNAAGAPNTANRLNADIVANVDQTPDGRPMFKPGEDPTNPSPQKPGRAINPGDPVNIAVKADPKGDDPRLAKAPADRAEIDRAHERRFKLDPEVIELARLMTQAGDKLANAKKIAGDPGDPAVANAQRKLNDLKKQYEQLWEEKAQKLREEIVVERDQSQGEIEVLQARRDGKAAEVQKAKALRNLATAVTARNARLKEKGRDMVSTEEVAKADAELAVAEAEVASKTAGLDEADALLNQVKRRLGIATTAKPALDPIARSPLTDDSKDADRDVVGTDAQDEVAVRQARRDGKAAELQKAEARLEQAKLDLQGASKLRDRQGISQLEFEKAQANLKPAEADVAARKAELAEAEIFLSQAKRGLGRRSTSTAPSSPTPTLPELRDTVELMEVQLQGKQAELRGVEAKFDSAKAILEARKKLHADGRITQIVMLESETNGKLAQSELEAKKAEVLESEVRIKQAKRRLDANEARLKREVERVKARLDWSEGMFKKGFVAKATYEADKAIYDELMIQLDPKYTPAPSLPSPAPAPSPVDQPRKEDTGAKPADTRAQLLIDIGRAKDRLEWSRDMLKKGSVSKATNEADQLTFDNLVKEIIRLDPNYAPDRPAPSPDESSREGDIGAKLSVKILAEKPPVPSPVLRYLLPVSNLGNKAAKGVKVIVTMPSAGGKLIALPPGAKFDTAARKLTWSIDLLEPGQGRELAFEYKTTTPGPYRATVEAISGGLRAEDALTVDVQGSAALDLQVTQTARVMDVGKTNFYDITIKNSGTKEATRLQLLGKLAGKLKILKPFNIEKGEFKFEPESGRFIFPEIERLGVGQTITLSLEVQATETGPAGCHVFLSHAEMGPQEAKIEDVISTTVTGNSAIEATTKPQAMLVDPRSFSDDLWAFW